MNNNIILLPTAEIREREEYRSLLTALRRAVYKELKESIARYGIQVPLIVNSNNVLLDGYHRLRIARELQIQYAPCTIRDFQNELEEREFVITVNVLRRHMNTAQKVEVAVKLLEIEREKAGSRKRLSSRYTRVIGHDMNDINLLIVPPSEGGTTETYINNHREEGEAGEAIKIVAKKLGISHNLLRKGLEILEAIRSDHGRYVCIAELWDRAKEGRVSVAHVYSELRRLEELERLKQYRAGEGMNVNGSSVSGSSNGGSNGNSGSTSGSGNSGGISSDISGGGNGSTSGSNDGSSSNSNGNNSNSNGNRADSSNGIIGSGGKEGPDMNAGMTNANVGKANIILADPPWQYEFGLRGCADQHYPCLTLEEIADIFIEHMRNGEIARDCILFLWTTAPKLREALQLLDMLGFNYKTSMVWVKDKIGTGYYVRNRHELLLIAVRGDMPLPLESNRPESVIFAERREHSRKPAIVYELIERMYPDCSYLELFAREKRNGWISYGLDLERECE